MVFGGTDKERIQLNESTIWAGGLRDRKNPGAGKAVPEIRRLLFAGQVAEAEKLAEQDMLAVPRRLPVYEPLGDLSLTFRTLLRLRITGASSILRPVWRGCASRRMESSTRARCLHRIRIR